MSQNVLTTTQIKELIEQGLASDNIDNVRVIDYEPDPNRRKYPFISVRNIQPDGTESDERVKTITQIFLVVFRVRKRGAGTNEVELQKSVEDSVLNKLDSTTLGSGTLFVENKIWSRPEGFISKPVPHYESRLRVLYTQVVSSSGSGEIIGDYTLTLPGLAGMKVLNKPLERETEITEDIFDDTRVRKDVAPISETHSFFAEIEYTTARRDAIRTLKDARSKISVTLARPSGTDIFNGKIVDMSYGATYSLNETIVIQIEVIP